MNDGAAGRGGGRPSPPGGEDDAGRPAAGESEPGWTVEDDDHTPETLRWLRTKRRAHRRQRHRDLAVVVYSVLLIAAGYGTTFVYRFARNLQHDALHGDTAAAIGAALPAALVFLALGLALLAARDALWRGPVVVPGPDAAWLLGQPVDRARVLRPWFRLTAGLGVLAGVLAAVAGALLLRITGLSPLGGALAACLPAGVCLPLLAVASAMRVESRPALARRVRALTLYGVLLLVALAAQTAAAWGGRRLPVLEQIELWSGPWGWAAQPVVDAAGGSAPGWAAALVALALLTAVAVVGAHRSAASVRNAQLRARAATAATVSSVIWSVELRAAKLAVAEALGNGSGGPPRRLPMPRSKYLVVVWRDALALLRAPGRVGRAALWTAIAAAVAALGASADGGARVTAVVVALLLGYVAVGALAEPARLEADDLRRSAWSPFRFATLMLMHAIVPAVVGVVLALLAAVPFAVRGAPWALLLMPLCAVPFAAAAVLAAVRGPVRTDLLFTGVPTPVGDPGFFVFLLWYVTAPLIPVTALGITLCTALGHGLAAGPLGAVALTSVLLTAVLLALARRRAGKLRSH
ncbi:DUF6297 family protein [Streptomyces sp. NPDC093589]|uniref:DUF6297 family protein n=1 Tax=Streptomyces sp. NPDC093589 TaxID=3366043 RepID=UPI00381513B5